MRGVDINWAGAERSFLYSIDLLRALEEKCDAGPAWILHRLANNQWRVNDVTETIRFGLEGGGMDKEAARKLVTAYFKDSKIGESILVAHAVLTDAIYSGEDPDQGEANAATET